MCTPASRSMTSSSVNVSSEVTVGASDRTKLVEANVLHLNIIQVIVLRIGEEAYLRDGFVLGLRVRAACIAPLNILLDRSEEERGMNGLYFFPFNLYIESKFRRPAATGDPIAHVIAPPRKRRRLLGQHHLQERRTRWSLH